MDAFCPSSCIIHEASVLLESTGLRLWSGRLAYLAPWLPLLEPQSLPARLPLLSPLAPQRSDQQATTVYLI